MAKPTREPRLTDRLNLVLTKAHSAVSIGRTDPKLALKGCEMADAALNEAMEIMSAIRRAAESI